MKNIISWVLRLTAAIILLQTLFFKFTGAPESIYIFEQVGMEPWGRYGSGIAELIASILIFMAQNRRSWGTYGCWGNIRCYFLPFDQSGNRSTGRWRSIVLPGRGGFCKLCAIVNHVLESIESILDICFWGEITVG